jgi:protein-S-isoprenylcysteine O-methyltransferase Ste14
MRRNYHMGVGSQSLGQDEEQSEFFGSQDGQARLFLRAPRGYRSWQAWLLGKVFPLAIFTLFFVTNGLALPGEAIQLVSEGMRLHPLMALIRHSLMLGFLLLIIAAYLTRSQAVARARGFRERIFPLLVLFATSFGMSFLRHAESTHRLDVIAIGLLLTVLGYFVSLWGLWYLRGSFGIMAEARLTVTSGPYRHVRHPIYLGEMLSMLGLCLTMNTAIALLFWAAITGMQLVRARIEEEKLAHQFADYKAYLGRTRVILPGLY